MMDAVKKIGPESVFLPLSTAFRHQHSGFRGQSGTAGHGIVRQCGNLQIKKSVTQMYFFLYIQKYLPLSGRSITRDQHIQATLCEGREKTTSIANSYIENIDLNILAFKKFKHYDHKGYKSIS